MVQQRLGKPLPQILVGQRRVVLLIPKIRNDRRTMGGHRILKMSFFLPRNLEKGGTVLPR
jgi:hypothetical protein